MSFLESLSKDQQTQVEEFIEAVYEAKLLNDIYKMLFKKSVYARLLSSQGFNQTKALSQMKGWVRWRQLNKVDLILEHDFLQYESIKEFMPTGFHEVDKSGRPIFYMQIGQLKASDLMQSAQPDVISKFFLKEMEHTWRDKFEKCEDQAKCIVDQIRIVVDLKGASLKQLTNKHSNAIFRALVGDLSKQFPEIVHSVIVLNAPMSFENHYLTEIKPQFSERTVSKILITAESSPAELLDVVNADRLPQIYGGSCNCAAQCIYSEKGPWTDTVNTIDFQNKAVTTTEQEWIDNRQGVGQRILGNKEEFKFMEDDDDQVDLLSEKDQLSQIKDMFQMNLPKPMAKKEKKKSQFASIDSHPMSRMQSSHGGVDYGGCTAQNTLADDSQATEPETGSGGSGTAHSIGDKQQQQYAMLAGMLNSKLNKLNVDGATPMNTHDAEARDQL